MSHKYNAAMEKLTLVLDVAEGSINATVARQ